MTAKQHLTRFSAIVLPLAAVVGMSSAAQADEWTPTRNIEFIAPANPGGGWDTLVRTTSRVIQEEGLAERSFG
ncbi:MAG: tripartite tricarboxylate transporter substrate binding protein, partial [Billgrantia desiderata]